MPDQPVALPPVEPPYTDGLAETLRKMTPQGVEPLLLFRTVAHDPDLLDAFHRFGGHFLRRGRLAAIDREVVIARTTARCGAAYEWGVHAHFFADRVGLSRSQLEATLRPDAATSSLFDHRHQVLIEAVDELHDTSRLSLRVRDELERRWSSPQLVELVALVGQYHLVSFLVNALAVPLETYLDVELMSAFQREAPGLRDRRDGRPDPSWIGGEG